MSWLTANLLPLYVIGGAFIAYGTVRLRFKLSPLPVIFGLCILIPAAIGSHAVVRGTPGQEETVPELHRVKPLVVESSHIRRLRLAWDSEDAPNWPAAETLALMSHIAYRPPIDAMPEFQALGFDYVMPVVAGSMIG